MQNQQMSPQIANLIGDLPIIPVIEINDISTARPLAEALVAGGLTILEVTLRTSIALDAIHEMTKVQGAVVAAGTIITPQDLNQAQQAGAKFAVSPGFTHSLLKASIDSHFPLMPGVSTASEAMQAYELGFSLLKFFPAQASGGTAAIKALAGPFKNIQFCATGGINADNAQEYLSLKNVSCVGGSWILDKTSIANNDWHQIQDNATSALKTLSR